MGADILAIRARELEPGFDPLSLPVYLALAAQLVAGSLLVSVLGFSIAPEVWWAAATWPWLIVGGMCMRSLGWTRLSVAVECLGLCGGQAWASFLVLAPLAAISAPFADAYLSAADKAIGFDFAAYAEAAKPYLWPLVPAYKSYNWQLFLVMIALCWTGRTTMCWRFVTAAAISLAITSVIFPLFPAEGPFVYYGFTEYEEIKAPWQFGPVLHALKDGARTLDYSLKSGLVSFPSYHAAAGCIYIWATWKTALRWLMVPLNTLLFLSTPVVGSHYAIDILGGFAVALASIVFANLLVPDQKLPAIT